MLFLKVALIFFIDAFHLVVPLVLPSLEVGTVFLNQISVMDVHCSFSRWQHIFFPAHSFYLVVPLVLPSLEVGTIF